MTSNDTLEEGDTVDVQTATEEYTLRDWGEEINGQYTYVMIDDEGREYKVAISGYEVMESVDND